MCHYRVIDSPIVRCFPEVGYERRINDILEHMQATLFPAWLLDLADLLGFARPYDRIYMVSNWWYCVRNVDFEQRTHRHDQAILGG